MKSFLKNQLGTIRKAKTVIAVLLGVLVIIDVILVSLDGVGFPTFSEVIRDNRSHLIWLTFLLGGLISKVFYNRKVHIKGQEISGFLTFMAMVVLLFALGYIIDATVGTSLQILLMVCGGILAYRAWPQYS